MHFHYVHHSKELGFLKTDKLKRRKVECNQSKVTMLISFKVAITGLWNWVDWVLKEPEKHYNHSTSHFYLPPNKDRTKAVAITRFVGHVARCVAIELPSRGQL